MVLLRGIHTAHTTHIRAGQHAVLFLFRGVAGHGFCNEDLSLACLCGSLAQCALSLKRLSAGPGFNPQTRLSKLFHDYWRACFEINFSDRQEGLTVSSIICDR